VSAPDGSALLTDLRRLCESTKPDHTPVVYSLGQLRAMLNAPVIAHNPDRAQIALLGVSPPGAGLVGLAYTIDTVADRPEQASEQVPEQAPEPVTRDPDPTAPGASGERVERRG